ncbi:MAG: leucine-rich repeat domain-containing protein, partial [Bacteroidota bacterium]
MLPNLDFNDNESLGYYTTFDKLFRNFILHKANDDQDLTIEVSFGYNEGNFEPSDIQVAAHEYLVTNGNQILETLVRYLKQHEEYFMEFYGNYIETWHEYTTRQGKKSRATYKYGFPAVKNAYQLINYFTISEIQISDEGADGMACISFIGSCTWEEEHGFGAVFHKSKLLLVGDKDHAYYASLDEIAKDALQKRIVHFFKLELLPDRKKRLSEESATVHVENPEAYTTLFDWLVQHKMIFGYRNTPVDLNTQEKIVLLTQIKRLTFNGQSLETIPSSIQLLKSLTLLSFSLNKIKTIPLEVCMLPSLRTLTIVHNPLERIPKQLSMLTNLEFLTIKNSGLQFLPEKIGTMHQLKLIDVSSNKLTALPSSFGELTQLTRLVLHNNSFTSFPEVLLGLPQLKNLNISLNQLTSLPESIHKIQSLT